MLDGMLCSKCKKRIAVLFTTRIEGNETIQEGLCFQCAKEMGIKPINDMIEKLGINEEDIDTMSTQLMDLMSSGDMGDFEMGGAQSFPFLQNMFGDMMPHASALKEDEEDDDEDDDTFELNESKDKPKQKKDKKEKDKDKDKKRDKKEKEFKFLTGYCQNLTDKAKNNSIDRIIGRDNEIYRLIQILNRRSKNNPCLIGEPGVGKTAIAEGIAQKLADNTVPPKLMGKELYLLDLTSLVAGTQFRGQFESRVKGLVADIKKAGNVILFIDEVHNLVGAGDSEGSMNAANILKPALSRGEIHVIGATTFKEYRKYIEKDSALERRFQPVKVEEPNVLQTIEIIKGIKDYYETFHRINVSDNIARLSAVLSERYITDRFLPDKAIDLLDEACSCATLRNPFLAEYDKLVAEKNSLDEQLAEAQSDETHLDYENISKLNAELAMLNPKVLAIEPKALGMDVTEEDLARVIELWTGVPASKIKENEISKVANLEDMLNKKIIGQTEATKLIASAVRRSRIQITPRRRPTSFIFVGPTGVGKTELVKVLSQQLFDSQEPLVRLDMSEFMEKHTVARIIGAPPGYVGYDEAGQLTEKIRRRPYSVVLFDEIEKAHPDVMNILLQILDEGKITDAQGRSVSFENTIIVMTSNAGSDLSVSGVGFNKDSSELAKEKALKGLRNFLRPEFLGRIDEIVAFKNLSLADFEDISALMLDELIDPMADKGLKFSYEKEVLTLIAKEAFGQKSGARDLRKTIRKHVEDGICNLLVDKYENPPTVITVVADDDKIVIQDA